MNNIKIEKVAINALESIIIQNNFLDSEFNSNDKEPSWDGHIYIYDSGSFSKKNLRVRIPVQIKGKVDDKNINKSRIKYSVNIDDLENYYNDMGVIYFVVLMDKCGEKTNVFYNLLYPIKIKKYLNRAYKKANKSSINIEFNKLNKKSSEMERISKQFVWERKKQGVGSGQVVSNEISIDELNNITEITGKILGAKDEFDILKGISNGDVCIYGKRKGEEMLFPVEYDPESKIYMKKHLKNNVCIDNKTYYKEYILISNYDEKIDEVVNEFKFSSNLTWNFNLHKFHFELEGTVNELKNDTDFLGKIIEYNFFYVSNVKIDFDVTKCSDNLRGLINYINDIYEIFKMLNIEYRKPFKLFEKNDFKELNYLCNIYRGNIDIKSTCSYDCYLSEKYIPIIILKQNDGVKFINRIYTNEVIPYISRGSDEKYRMPNIYKVNSDVLAKIYLFNYDEIYKQIEESDFNEDTSYDLNLIAINLISSYDINKDAKLLDLAKYILIKLINIENDNDIYRINILQIKKRIGTISNDDNEYLLRLKNNTNDMELLCCINILLEDFIQAHNIFLDMHKDIKERFSKFPIYNLMNIHN